MVWKIASACALALTTLPIAASAQNLVNNGSFELNTLDPGQYRDMLVSSADLPGWTIIGLPQTRISQVDQQYGLYGQNPGYHFPAQDGKLWVDLAGYSDNAPDGVQQSVATQIGQSYDFSFWLGNISGGAFGTQSSVAVAFSAGLPGFTCTNDTDTMTMTWKQCSTTFVAADTQTTFSISSLDPTSDYSNAIDNVVLTLSRAGPASVPEPAAWALMVLGFGAIGAGLRRIHPNSYRPA